MQRSPDIGAIDENFGQSMSPAMVETAEARAYLVRQGFSMEEALHVETKAIAEEGTFSRSLLLGLGQAGLDDIRKQLRCVTSATPPVDSELVCVFDGIGRGTHKSDKNPVQRKPFSRAKWVQLIQPLAPMCESCTSTLRKHYTGTTNSPELAAAFVHTCHKYTCHRCNTENDAVEARRVGNMCCASCGWTAGSKKGRKTAGTTGQPPVTSLPLPPGVIAWQRHVKAAQTTGGPVVMDSGAPVKPAKEPRATVPIVSLAQAPAPAPRGMPIPLNSATSLPDVDVNAFEEDFGHAVGSFGELSIGELSPAESLHMSTLSQCSTLRRELSGELSGIPAMSPISYA